MDRWFKAVHARTGELLWQFEVESGIIGQPVTYRGPDGKQYVAILAGVGGWAGAIVAAGLDARDASSALGITNAMKDLPSTRRKAADFMFSRCHEESRARDSGSRRPCSTKIRADVFSKLEFLRRMIVVAAISLAASAQAEERVMRICADPNNLPFSNQRSKSFEPA